MTDRKIDRRTMLRGAAGAVAAAPLARLLAAEGDAPRPNILMILVDDLGYGDLSGYGAKDMRTPHVDALAAGGMRFRNFYANCPVCSPTRAALLTGRYPALVGVPGVIRTHDGDNWGHLSREAVLLPEALRKAGYDTAIVGKWHLGLASPNTPNDRGFDHFHGFLGDMMDDYHTHRRHGINYLRLDRQEIDPKGHATDLFTQWAVEYLQGRKGKAKPFFLYLAYNAPHTPIQPPAEWLAKVQKRQPDLPAGRAKLVALIEHMDDGIGQVTAALKQAGLADSTLVIFSSDNGGQSGVGANNGPTRAGKGTMYEGGLRVPTCAVWPGKIARGVETDRVALTMDLYPTILEAAGAANLCPKDIEGRSVLPLLLGREMPAEDRMLFFTRREGGPHKGGTSDAVIAGGWKLLRNLPGAKLELYNLRDDPREQRNLAAGTDRPAVYDRLAQALEDYVRRHNAVPWRRPKGA
ncbi:MAG TPA: sulfatase [Phycisphaerae bacterium]|nr:sulfatase [Phycisphaerae bacterium]